MKSLHFILFVSLLSAVAVCAQAPSSNATPALTSKTGSNAPSDTTKRAPAFRANKDQVMEAQKILKTKGIYSGEATGKLDPATRASVKSYQKENGLRATGSLNRATLEKLGIALTDKQKAIPVREDSLASNKSSGDRPKRNIFRATKEQIMDAQKLLKNGGMYAGDETGKLDDPTREGLKKYQEAKGLKVTGTLNQATLEKMGIALTDKQKGAGEN